jgi:hypothetical protein
MLQITSQLFNATYEAAKVNRVLVHQAKGCWGEDMFETVLSSGVKIHTCIQDDGATQAIRVPGLLNVTRTYMDAPKFWQGDDNALRTVARMLGLDIA